MNKLVDELKELLRLALACENNEAGWRELAKEVLEQTENKNE